MIRFLVRAAIFLVSTAIGLLVAKLVLDDMSIDATAFIVVVVIVAVLQAVIAPFIAKTTARNAPALLGAAGLISTFIALVVANVVVEGLTITGLTTWILATLIVWLVTMIAAFLLPVILVALGLEQARQRRD
ncbi:MAG: hypothetical protein ACJ73J_11435 [Actinomycetes bacterium]